MANAKRGFNFNSIQTLRPNFSKFNLSHDHLCAMGSGYLIPLWWTEGLPGDSFRCNLSSFVRILALSSPMLQREDITVRAFKVPLRILASKKDLDNAYAGDKDGNHIDYPFVTCSSSNMTIGSLYDYLQLPLPYYYDSSTGSWVFNDETYQSPVVSIFPFLAYHRIYHDHFRNEDTESSWLDVFDQPFSSLDDEVTSVVLNDYDSDAPSSFHLDTLHKVCWERDYFTSALSNPQRGSQVSIPLVGDGVVKGRLELQTTDKSTIVPPSGGNLSYTQRTVENVKQVSVDLPVGDNHYKPTEVVPGSLVVDGSTFTGIGAVALRMAMNLQAFMERNNFAGYRMIGNILAHFGVRSSNRLLDEAEYLGGIKSPITISAVTQTSASESGSTPQGTQVGQAQASFNGHLFSTFCEEPCIIMVVGYITGKSSYSQGLARKWTRRSYLDYYWPEFQTIGEQEILNQEVFFDFQQGAQNDGVWAYQSRFSEYKYEPDSIAGDFRTSLSYWHQSRLFTSLPAFNDSFVKSNLSDRVFALNSETYPRQYLGEFFFDCQAVRPMDKYAISKLW